MVEKITIAVVVVVAIAIEIETERAKGRPDESGSKRVADKRRDR